MFIDSPCTYLMFSSCIKMFYFYLDTLYLHPYLMFPPVSRCFLFYLDTLYLPLPDVFLLYPDVFFFIWTPCTYPYLMFPPVSRCFLFYLDTLYLHPYLMFSSCIKMFLDLVQQSLYS